MSWTTWRTHFEHSARRPLPPLPTTLDLPEEIRRPLVRTLAVFERGETGEGRIAAEVRRADIDGVDEDYHRALALFIQEEGRHALILRTSLAALGAEPRKKALAEAIFRMTRRGMDVRHELLVLLAAEVVAVVFYDALARAVPCPELAAALGQIVCDEHQHLAFHMDFFRATLSGTRARMAWQARWWAITSAACATVLLDHRATFKALGIDRGALVQDVHRTIAEVDRQVLRPSLLDGRVSPLAAVA